jgi:hypothetical protein
MYISKSISFGVPATFRRIRTEVRYQDFLVKLSLLRVSAMNDDIALAGRSVPALLKN